MVSLVAAVFGIVFLVAMTAMGVGLVYVAMNEESHAHTAAQNGN